MPVVKLISGILLSLSMQGTPHNLSMSSSPNTVNEHQTLSSLQDEIDLIKQGKRYKVGNYLFRKDKRKEDGTLYLRCQNHKGSRWMEQCKARAKLMADGTVVVTRGHSHPPPPDLC